MRSLMGFIRTTVRILLGAFFLCLGIATATSIASGSYFDLPPNASTAYVSGRVVGALVFMLIGVVGFKMMTRRSLPRQSA